MIKFNPTGTHVQKGFLRVRFDVFIDDPTSKTYSMFYIPVIDETSQEYLNGYKGERDMSKPSLKTSPYGLWLASLPRIWKITEALSYFVNIPETVVVDDLMEYITRLFDANTIATIDNVLVRPDSAHLISPYMKKKTLFTDKVVGTKDYVDLVSTVNQRLASIQRPLPAMGEPFILEPESIDIGAAATDRGANWE